MAGMSALQMYPFQPGGAAEGVSMPSGAVVLTDLTAQPRFGLKGAGSAVWLAKAGVSLPSVNHAANHRGIRVLRLGNEEILLLGEGEAAALVELREQWSEASAPKGYSSWREEGWAWMRLSGPALGEALAQLCALDLRPVRFGGDEIAQTRFAGIEVVLLRSADGFDILFDITASAAMARAVAAAGMR